ncbi:MAG: pyridoxamine 5'-phosphate oxidase family protein [Methylococcaceae bacterium]|jgi:hypothetical protein
MLYGPEQQKLQKALGTEKLAERVAEAIVVTELNEQHQNFIASRELFFLTTVDHRGYPTCSYKGGNPGFVKVLDNKTLLFPSYDGNGMFLSMGNINENNKVGLLFIDFETPHRVRVHGTATIEKNSGLLAESFEAELIVRVSVTEAFVNCPRYIHQYQRIATSKYVPQAGRVTPVPQWKRIDAIQDCLPEKDKLSVAALGEPISPENYAELLQKGEG